MRGIDTCQIGICACYEPSGSPLHAPRRPGCNSGWSSPIIVEKLTPARRAKPRCETPACAIRSGNCAVSWSRGDFGIDAGHHVLKPIARIVHRFS